MDRVQRSCPGGSNSNVQHSTLLKQSRQYLSVVQLPVDVDLPLSDVASEVGNGVSDVVVGHSQNGDLCDGPVPPLHTSGSLERDTKNALCLITFSRDIWADITQHTNVNL